MAYSLDKDAFLSTMTSFEQRRGVPAACYSFFAMLNKQVFTAEVLITTLTIMENLLNGRPLTYLSDDATEPEILTPHHLLTGPANPNLPADVFDDSDLTFRKRWRFSEALATNFWRRWMKEFLPSMAERKEWFWNQSNISVGDLVMIFVPNTPCSCWPLGRVARVIPGKDGVVRSAFVRIGDTELHRPAVKLRPLTQE